MGLAHSLSNIKIGKKLGAGFIIVIAASLAITVIAFDCFRSIKDNSARRTVTVEMVNTLSKARLNRTLYQYTKDEQFAVRNVEALKELASLYQRLGTFSWDAEGLQKVNQLGELMRSYRDQREKFVAAAKETTGTFSAITPATLIKLAHQLESLNRGLTPETAPPVMQLTATLYDTANIEENFLKNPGETSRDAITDKFITITTLTELLGSFNQGDITTATQAVLATINQQRPALIPYMNAFSTEKSESTSLTAAAERLNAGVAEMFSYQSQLSASFIKGAEWRIAIAALICVVLSLLIAWRITRNITHPLRETLSAAQRIAAGDLTISLNTTRGDELGQLMQAVDTMNHSLQTIIANVRSGVSSVARASAEIAAGNTDLSSRTEQQSAAVVQTAASMEQLTSTVKQNAENAHHASQLATDASGNAGRGGEIIRDVITTMSGISQSSGKIGEIINVINSISPAPQ